MKWYNRSHESVGIFQISWEEELCSLSWYNWTVCWMSPKIRKLLMHCFLVPVLRSACDKHGGKWIKYLHKEALQPCESEMDVVLRHYEFKKRKTWALAIGINISMDSRSNVRLPPKLILALMHWSTIGKKAKKEKRRRKKHASSHSGYNLDRRKKKMSQGQKKKELAPHFSFKSINLHWYP